MNASAMIIKKEGPLSRAGLTTHNKSQSPHHNQIRG